MLNTKALHRRLGGKLSLPSLPEVVLRVQEMVGDPDCSIKEIGELISEDPPLAARLLRIANSAFYSLSAPVLDIGHAAAVLGVNALQDVLMQVTVADLFSKLGPNGEFDAREMWKHSTLTARLMARAPRRLFSEIDENEVFITGLLHDIGKFVLFEQLHREFAEATVEAQRSGRDQGEVERSTFGFNHADVGLLVAERWHLPRSVSRAIGEHHDAKVARTGEDLTLLLVAADHIAHETFERDRPRLSRRLPKKVVERLELTPEEIQTWVACSIELQALEDPF